MSKLKEAFQGICQRHLTDNKTVFVLKKFIPVQDLVEIVEKYLVDEFTFETELLVLAFCCKVPRRVSRLLLNSNNKYIDNWLCFLRQHLDCIARDLAYAISWGGDCNRPCCWYHHHPEDRYSVIDRFPCGCGQPVTYTHMNAHNNPQIFQLFSHAYR